MRMPTDAETCALLRQLSGRDSIGKPSWSSRFSTSGCVAAAEDEGWEWEELCRKKVIAVVDGSAEAKVAMLWTLSHVVNRFDMLTLLHVIDTRCKRGHDARNLATSLAALCKSRRPEAEVEAVVVEGEKAVTIVSQAKKLQASLLVLGQRKPSLFQRFFQRRKDEVVDYCIQHADCLALSVRKQSSGVGGYLINSRWQKNFWLLA